MIDDPTPTDPAERRAERARRNGARSRGPATARGKARSSRNALRHGLTAKVHLVLDRDDEADFMALAGGLEGELSPRGPLEGFLVARLTAAMWHTGRAERMEARAFQAGPDPNPDRLRLALRYRGSVQRELFRCLRAIQELRRRPLSGCEDVDEAGADTRGHGVVASHASIRPAAQPGDLARVAVAAWGGERTGPVPPGFLELRPVPNVWPVAWRFTQDRAFPGDVPLLVYGDGTVRSPDGELLDDVWSPGLAIPPAPAQTPVEPLAPSAAVPDADETVAPADATALDWLDGNAGDLADDLLMLGPPRRNEPSQTYDSERFLIAERSATTEAAMDPMLGFDRIAPDLTPCPPGPEPEPKTPEALPPVLSDTDALVEALVVKPSGPDEPESRFDAMRSPADHASPPAGLGAWEQMWGITRPEPELEMATLRRDLRPAFSAAAPGDDANSRSCPRPSEPDQTKAEERKCTNELSPRTSEPETPGADRGRSYHPALDAGGADPGVTDLAAPVADDEVRAKLGLRDAPELRDPSSRADDPSRGRPGRLRRCGSKWPRWRTPFPKSGE